MNENQAGKPLPAIRNSGPLVRKDRNHEPELKTQQADGNVGFFWWTLK